ncbi:MAG: GNAT family N-acetyltransferase [bacterium]
MIIKVASINDIDQVIALINASDEEQKDYPGYLERKENADEILKEEILSRIDDPDYLYLVAKEDEEVIGIIVANIVDWKTTKANRCGILSNLFVIKELRGSGVADKLVEEAFVWLKENKIYIVDIYVFPGNVGAQRFWDKMGFHKILDLRSKDLRC